MPFYVLVPSSPRPRCRGTWRARWRHFQWPLPAIPILVHTVLAPMSVRANAVYFYRWLKRSLRVRTRFGSIKRRLFG